MCSLATIFLRAIPTFFQPTLLLHPPPSVCVCFWNATKVNHFLVGPDSPAMSLPEEISLVQTTSQPKTYFYFICCDKFVDVFLLILLMRFMLFEIFYENIWTVTLYSALSLCNVKSQSKTLSPSIIVHTIFLYLVGYNVSISSSERIVLPYHTYF